jgi:hypothetical protein
MKVAMVLWRYLQCASDIGSEEPVVDLSQPPSITRDLEHPRAVHQQLNAWKFVVYSEWAGAELLPAA